MMEARLGEIHEESKLAEIPNGSNEPVSVLKFFQPLHCSLHRLVKIRAKKVVLKKKHLPKNFVEKNNCICLNQNF